MRRLLKSRHHQRVMAERQRQAAACTIQRAFKGYLAIQMLNLMRRNRRAAIVVQRAWRGYKGRCFVHSLRAEVHRLKVEAQFKEKKELWFRRYVWHLRSGAVRRIQRWFRVLLGPHLALRAWKRKKLANALIIQRWYRARVNM